MNHGADGEAMAEVVVRIKQYQDAVDRFDALAAESLQVNTTDLRCLTALYDRGPLPASEIARTLELTRGSTTTALRRIEALGYIVFKANAADARSVIVSLTYEGTSRIRAVWSPMRRRGTKHLSEYTHGELEVLLRFLAKAIALQNRCAADLRRSCAEMAGIAKAPSSVHRKRRGAIPE